MVVTFGRIDDLVFRTLKSHEGKEERVNSSPFDTPRSQCVKYQQNDREVYHHEIDMSAMHMLMERRTVAAAA